MPKLPNVLILMTDQQRADCLSCAGHPQLRTPNLDRIASEGVRFSQATTVSPVCMPARASFINSLYPHNHGMWRNAGSMPPDDDTFFHQMQRLGYKTAYIGKSHYYNHGRGHLREHEGYMHARGLDFVHEVTGPLATQVTRSYMTDSLEKANLYQAFKEDYAVRCGVRKENPFLVRPSPLPVEHYLDSYVGRVTEEYLASYEESCPLCLFVGFPGPHEPWDAPGEYATMYAEESAPAPIPWSQGDLPESIAGMEDFRPMGSSTLENIRRVRTNYYGKISLIDSWIGRIIETCVERGIWDDTFVAFWSDHGDMLGDHRRVFKSTFHESSMRVPLLLRWPDRFPRGVVLDSLVEIIDFYPTLMESLGGETATRCQGRSLVPLTDQVETEVRTTQLSEILHAEERRVCLRTRSHKYAVRENGDGFMLYDLEQDPFEQDNLIGRAPEVEARVREMLFRRLLDGQYSMERSSIEGFPRGPHRSS